MPAPAVSIVIPAYNSAPFIAGTLESVFAQTFTDYEVLVVNDGSPDTPAFEAALAPYRERITYLVQRNTGPSGARNLAIREARGEFIALLDSDDVWLPTFLEEQIRRMREQPSLALLYSDGSIVGGALDGRRLMEVTPSHPDVTVERLIAEECTVLTSCTVARRQALIDAGLFPDQFRRSEDAHLWLRVALRGGRIAWHATPLVRHRRREGSLSHDTPAMVRAYIDVLADLEPRLPFTPPQRALIRRQIARRKALVALDEGKQLFIAGRYPEAAEALARARANEPALPRQLRFGLLEMGLRVAPRLLHRAYATIRV
ncbi:MAG: glycosyltransferase family 2 protein [Vicinamibacterales bacterium]